ncbi:MAG: cupin domain-containing protein, partial [Eudoraea sp.]
VKTTESWNGVPLPKYLDGNPEITILKMIIPPKTKLPLHKHPEINAGVVLKGELTVISETNDTLYFKAGEPIVELVNTWHFGRNDGTEPVEIIVFYAGVKGTPITILKK